MAPYRKIELSRLREIGWRDWDPMGLAASSCPRNEYDRYLLHVVVKLRRGEPAADAEHYLVRLATDNMDLGPEYAQACLSAQTTVCNIQRYIDAFPPGPLIIG